MNSRSGPPSTPPLSQLERARLADLLDELGPDRPTLCEGWTTGDLAAHLVVRERRPDAQVGLFVPGLARYSERVRQRAAGESWPQLVAKVRSGPPPWSPMAPGPVDRAANTLEFFVHHEDVRRAQPGWEPRWLDPSEVEQLWGMLRRAGRMLYRHAPVGVLLRRTDGGEARARTIAGRGTVQVVGEVAELVLHAFGRTTHAQVQLRGQPEDVAALAAAPLGV